MLRKLFGPLLLGGALFAACSSPSPSTSSSSHWVKCHDLDDCAALTNAVACSDGYCVDSTGTRLSVSGLVACDDGTDATDCCPPDAAEDGACQQENVRCSRGGCMNGNESFLYCGDGKWSAGKGVFPCTVANPTSTDGGTGSIRHPDASGTGATREGGTALVACNDGTGATDCCPPDAVEDGACDTNDLQCSRGGCVNENESFLYCAGGTWSAGHGLFPCAVPSDAGSAHASTGCDPLAEHEKPAVLATVIAVGVGPDGVTYLVDESTRGAITDNHFYISDGTTLVRQRLNGNGIVPAFDDMLIQIGTDYSLFFHDADASVLVSINWQVRGGLVESMFLGPLVVERSTVMTPLTLKTVDGVSGFTLKNLPGDARIEGVAHLDDGTSLIITLDNDYPEDGERLFWGPGDHLTERHIVDSTTTKEGNPSYEFQVDSSGETLTVSFNHAVDTLPDGGANEHPGPVTLVGSSTTTQGTEEFPPPLTLPPSLSFTCL